MVGNVDAGADQGVVVQATTQLDRAITNLEARIATRLDAMDKAVALTHDDLVRMPTQIDREIAHLHELLIGDIHRLSDVSNERFGRIDMQFVERDKRTDQLTVAASTAIAAALQAQKEAVAEQNKSSALAIAKSENSTAESIRQLQTLFNSANTATNDKINDVKSRLDKGEGTSQGTAATTTRSAATTSNLIAGAVAFVVTITAIVTVIAYVLERHAG